ncbi:hypothetical protein F5B20DRAFT_564161 [Whalleya microplaca]|nr:hypothetical protein F5B20DRAFT_564161 [Whalleya microplaca]
MAGDTTLDKLPLEMLQQVAGWLYNTHLPSLSSLALVNKAFYNAATTFLFRDIHLEILGRQKLCRDVQMWLQILSRTEKWVHVRSLHLSGKMPNKDEDLDKLEDDPWELNDANYYGTDEIFGKDQSTVFTNDDSAEVPLQEDVEAWMPLLVLLQRLPHVADVIYTCNGQLPSCLLDAIHKHHPHCRLHHGTFRYRGLPLVDPNELAIATSPCLHAIKVLYTRRNSRGSDDYNEEASIRTIAGLAPNLKEVEMIQCRPALSPELRRARTRPRQPWKDLIGVSSEFKPGMLESLKFCGCGSIPLKKLKLWQEHTSFAALRCLKFSSGIKGETMRWASSNCSFPSLKQLCIKLDRDDMKMENPEFINDAVAFLTSLPPLDEMMLSGSLETEIFDYALSHLGRTLRKIEFSPSESMYSITKSNRPMIFTREHILQIQEKCPMIENLRMPIKRSKSDRSEVESYRTFGKMVRLRTLFLVLDCANPGALLDGDDTPNDPLFDEFDQQFWGHGFRRCPRNGHIKNQLMNCAVDEQLARSIWDTICQAKEGSSLQSLRLHTSGGSNLGMNGGQSDFLNMAQRLSLSFLLERNIRDDDSNIVVQELGKRARLARDEDARKHDAVMVEKWGEDSISPRDGTALQIFRMIWLPKEGSRDWRDDWESLPLQV